MSKYIQVYGEYGMYKSKPKPLIRGDQLQQKKVRMVVLEYDTSDTF